MTKERFTRLFRHVPTQAYSTKVRLLKRIVATFAIAAVLFPFALFFHGSADKMVPYDKTRFFHLGMFGSNTIAKKFRQEKHPYLFYSMEGIGHEVAEYPMEEFLPEIEQFIQDWVFDRKRRMVDIRYEDMARASDDSLTPANYYN